MPISLEELKDQNLDYFIARWRNGELEMVPHCACGLELDETYRCETCGRDCRIQTIVCEDIQTMEVVRRFLHGNPDFRNFTAHMKAESS